ncbi:holo-ACP synthase [Thioalkalivibrio sp. XN8]|uniref:holo-ACP synthase n=1 Tax=Thioalkalivibrio sp. XN8 TaxID=2712863 RepID=UPI0013EBD23B|nr:holo-ACP synthase [Thioalkalivibrio sp. XN8]
MIFGIGTDVVRLDRIEAMFARFGEHFVQRLLMPEEEAQFRRNGRQARFLAMRFAGKEAVVKAMGTGFRHGMWLRDVGIVADDWGKPEIVFSARGRARCAALGIAGGHVSLTDEAGLVVAFVVLTRSAA